MERDQVQLQFIFTLLVSISVEIERCRKLGDVAIEVNLLWNSCHKTL